MSGCRRFIPPVAAVVLCFSLFGCADTAPPALPVPPRSFSIFFATDSAALTPEAIAVIDQIAEEARRIRATAVGIVGTSSAGGTSPTNLRLSEQRAATVEEALLARDVPHEIIVRTYHGAAHDLAGPALEAQRVEVVVSREERR